MRTPSYHLGALSQSGEPDTPKIGTQAPTKELALETSKPLSAIDVAVSNPRNILNWIEVWLSSNRKPQLNLSRKTGWRMVPSLPSAYARGGSRGAFSVAMVPGDEKAPLPKSPDSFGTPQMRVDTIRLEPKVSTDVRGMHTAGQRYRDALNAALLGQYPAEAPEKKKIQSDLQRATRVPFAISEIPWGRMSAYTLPFIMGQHVYWDGDIGSPMEKDWTHASVPVGIDFDALPIVQWGITAGIPESMKWPQRFPKIAEDRIAGPDYPWFLAAAYQAADIATLRYVIYVARRQYHWMFLSPEGLQLKSMSQASAGCQLYMKRLWLLLMTYQARLEELIVDQLVAPDPELLGRIPGTSQYGMKAIHSGGQTKYYHRSLPLGVSHYDLFEEVYKKVWAMNQGDPNPRTQYLLKMTYGMFLNAHYSVRHIRRRVHTDDYTLRFGETIGITPEKVREEVPIGKHRHGAVKGQWCIPGTLGARDGSRPVLTKLLVDLPRDMRFGVNSAMYARQLSNAGQANKNFYLGYIRRFVTTLPVCRDNQGGTWFDKALESFDEHMGQYFESIQKVADQYGIYAVYAAAGAVMAPAMGAVAGQVASGISSAVSSSGIVSQATVQPIIEKAAFSTIKQAVMSGGKVRMSVDNLSLLLADIVGASIGIESESQRKLLAKLVKNQLAPYMADDPDRPSRPRATAPAASQMKSARDAYQKAMRTRKEEDIVAALNVIGEAAYQAEKNGDDQAIKELKGYTRELMSLIDQKTEKARKGKISPVLIGAGILAAGLFIFMGRK